MNIPADNLGAGLVVYEDVLYIPQPGGSWNGIDQQTLRRCMHGLSPARRVAWGSEHGGRRFLGCPLNGEECEWSCWVDPEHGTATKKYLASLHLDLENTMVKLEDANEDKSCKDNHFISNNKMMKERLLSISADSKKKDYLIIDSSPLHRSSIRADPPQLQVRNWLFVYTM
ncbi:unnamed protein product [Triticum aestivum]|uniref:Uncharacterized protein n=1 Tax=Triticum aestivum TaxID=4565 RepID=A0A7H4LNM2_WHEAT|nr:unnamed protein product [Triticum aestivum]